jgi:hypothetical protein
VLLALFLGSPTALAQNPSRAAFSKQNDTTSNSADTQFFEQKIRPILAQHCYECHSSQAKKLRGSLRLDNRAGLFKGGNTGPAVVPGKPDNSLLIQALRNNGLAMPPKGKLPDQVIADFERWVASGAPDPRDNSTAPATNRAIDLNAARKQWPYQPPQRHTAPQVEDASWARSDIDQFVFAGLEARGLHPAPDADRAVLLRRVTIDLIGLLPTPEETDAFVADRSPDAFAKVVDRLLASPHFGERWGRHWLDVARYADSNGKDENLTFHEAWRYRDYVIASFNRDRPFNQFIREQLAGDLLPAANQAQRDEHLVATGFLVVGPKVLFDRDPLKRKMDVVDEQIDTVGRTFLGLTLGCARCHDHKFDPIPTKDYYALAGIFASTRTLDGIKENNPLVSGWMLRPLGAGGERLRAVQLAHQHKQEATGVALRKSRAELLALQGHAETPDAAQRMAAAGAAVKDLEAEERRLQTTAPPSPPLAMAVRDEDTPVDTPVNLGGNPHSTGPRVPRGFLQVASVETGPKLPPDQSGRRELAAWLASPDNPLTARVFVNRVWMHLFGDGLVRSVDNFGAQGERPTHPELLDDLAVRFMEDGWSVKKLVRTLVLSRTYQMAAAENADAARIDPENKLLWRANLRRMDAEAVRDAILCVSGRLDWAMGGSAVSGMDEFATNNGGKGGIVVDGNTRRSVYLPVIRNDLPSLFEVFDFADPDVSTGRRNVTTGPAQALYLMNSPFVMDQARDAARRLLAVADDRERLDLLYRLAFGRTPTRDERRSVMQFLGERHRESTPGAADELAAWTGVCQAVFGCVEFRFVR